MSDTVRVCAPDTWAREVDGITGRRYKSKDGVYEMHPADAAKLVKLGSFIPTLAGHSSPRNGYRCATCGFGSYFRRCSRCGGDCEKES